MAWKDGLCESGLYKSDAGEVNLGKIESGSRYAGIYKLRLHKIHGVETLSSLPLPQSDSSSTLSTIPSIASDALISDSQPNPVERRGFVVIVRRGIALRLA